MHTEVFTIQLGKTGIMLQAHGLTYFCCKRELNAPLNAYDL